ncbi:hypothetical protein EGW08_005594 [Elysia chlorotica]|uniref:Small monomeric GTPase n=1 Tax=Elysia chlorotica TaxID=188477 RepID=A0A3S0ZU11_ELYCH|nr:hypothetical protein EGW08_005594 [Elysia chlorotica]
MSYLSPVLDHDCGLQPLRSFVKTPKGLVNRGDSLRSRSTSSVFSSCSGSTTEITPQSRSRTSSSISYGSACSHSPVCPASPVPHNNNINSSHHHSHPQHNNSHNSHGSSSCIAPVPPPDPPYRVTVLGCGGVGKRALTQQFTTSQYLGGGDSPFSHEHDKQLFVSVLLDGKETALEFLTPSENLNLHAVQGPDAFVIVFTIDDRSTFERATDLLYELRKMDDWPGPVILVANKCDLVRTKEMSTDEAKSVATTYDCKYIETSVVLNHNVDELLVGVVSQIRLNAHTPNTGSTAQGRHHHDGSGTNSTGNAKESGCYGRSKHLLNKIFRKDYLSKSCENLYVL